MEGVRVIVSKRVLKRVLNKNICQNENRDGKSTKHRFGRALVQKTPPTTKIFVESIRITELLLGSSSLGSLGGVDSSWVMTTVTKNMHPISLVV